ncbi:MAG TPA: S-layer homology domain-containing protein [Methylomusa anaerophila]|uniref:Outer membrane protein alpha n=1 Tax=Methylomusa anaerophila TaxID=1930071 RepID=A0A348AKI8_9FIRM|nr:S-layer homology domain-containing protein [Methylomusa anaerophila]BBB91586.1 outer membrane protein alpha precursor [Methylomusa anaerophila]HML89476.1 S-layer homology domain-containing protein [Methylomusa anaerophila]
MKKQIALALAAAFTLSVAGTALAAPANPFVDVPANHWSYDAVNKLVKAGVVSGYGDGTYKGDRTLTRYEMATVVAKAMANSEKADAETKATIDKLQTEFASELNNLGVRVANLEKNASSIKFSGDARVRFAQNRGTSVPESASTDRSYFRERIRLNLASDIADNLTFKGQIVAENESNNRSESGVGNRTSNTDRLHFEQAEFDYQSGKLTSALGRLQPTFGEGILWDGSQIDGALLTYRFNDKVALAAGYGDLDPNNLNGVSTNAFYTDLKAKVSNNVNLTVTYLKTNKPMISDNGNGTPVPYDYQQFAYGFDAKLGKNFTLIGEGVRNGASDSDLAPYTTGAGGDVQKNGWWGRLQYKGTDLSQPGTFTIYADYLKLGNWALDPVGWAGALNVGGGDYIGGNGAKGWGAGFEYVYAKNADLALQYYDLKPYDTGRSGFDSYKKFYSITTNFRF